MQNSSFGHTLSREIVIGAGVVAQLISLNSFWYYTSDEPQFLGRFSWRFGLVFVFCLINLVLWSALFFQRRRIIGWLDRLPKLWLMGFVTAFGIAALGLWFTTIEARAAQYVALNWLLVAALGILSLPDRATRFRRWPLLLTGVLIPLLILVLMGNMSMRPWQPDEPFWADMGASFFSTGQVYSRLWLRDSGWPINPGYGWSLVGYGWLLHHLGFKVEVGRVWVFAFHCLTFFGVYLVAARLYGRRAGIISAAFAALSLAFLGSYDYRPNHQLPAAALLAVFAALQGRCSPSAARRRIWHVICGLVVTLSLELHAAGINFAVAMTLFYTGELVIQSFRLRRLAAMKHLVWYVVGAAIGSLIFYIFNISPVGGLQVYLRELTIGYDARWSWSFSRLFFFTTWPSLLEFCIISSGFAYLLWRRNQADRYYLGIVLCFLIAAGIFNTNPYLSVFSGLYPVIVGPLIVDGFRSALFPPGLNRRGVWIAGCILIMMFGQLYSEILSKRPVGYFLIRGELPPFLFYELTPALQPYIQPDDKIVSLPDLIWTFPDYDIVTFTSEMQVAQKWGLQSTEEVWEQVQPTAIVGIPQLINFPAGLQEYISRNAFEICSELRVMNFEIDIYRRDCTMQ